MKYRINLHSAVIRYCFRDKCSDYVYLSPLVDKYGALFSSLAIVLEYSAELDICVEVFYVVIQFVVDDLNCVKCSLYYVSNLQNIVRSLAYFVDCNEVFDL